MKTTIIKITRSFVCLLLIIATALSVSSCGIIETAANAIENYAGIIMDTFASENEAKSADKDGSSNENNESAQKYKLIHSILTEDYHMAFSYSDDLTEVTIYGY